MNKIKKITIMLLFFPLSILVISYSMDQEPYIAGIIDIPKPPHSDTTVPKQKYSSSSFPLDAAKKRKLENKKIRKLLRAKNKDGAVLAVIQHKRNHVSKIKPSTEQTLASFDASNQLITIYDSQEHAYHRSYEEFQKLMQEKSSDDDDDGTFEHTYQHATSSNEMEQWIAKEEKKSKKCCCVLT